MKNKVVETCEMCSAEVNDPITIKVEGALLRVCPRCKKFGNVVEEPSDKNSSTSSTKTKKKSKKSKKRNRSSKSKSGSSRSSRSSSNRDEDDRVLISDYGEIIKKARMKKNLTQEQLSRLTGVGEAYIKSIEAQKMKPTERVATKLERQLNIELFEDMNTELEHRETSDDKDTTVGDIVSIKRLDFD